ncbi:XylR N-terminal domain-containing protein [Schinkia azotoformans]|uniref:XylR N-terminal domain-containing protein n=1 Tax=Schinkia azotoformans TaxID=1454 RepID=UPI002DB9DBD9|nr:XylR N-terminal domain-containing protein [Schinkia azotoformans]MEC1770441.1 XylR N-terminal domain-containing protein [Schinkia azotoformans]MED4366618.1 XylR N-terminal domain-containing protein [Schinkia azotoformans]
MSKNLLNNLDIKQENGAIFLDNERILLTPSAVFGTLRKELIENIGMARVKGFLLRYGWNLGKYDAEKVLDDEDIPSIKDILKQGPIQHMIKGYTKVHTIKTDIEWEKNGEVKSVYVEGEWFNSYEAEEHLNQFGMTDLPICYTLIGYASGFYSTICGHTVIFKELSCKGMGMHECKYIGKSIHNWNGEADEELKYYENSTIIKELERTYETLLQERNNLSKATEISKRITQALINGSDLQSIVNDVSNTLKIPILIEDVHFRDYVSAGLSKDSLETIQQDFTEWMDKKHSDNSVIAYSNMRKIIASRHTRLMTPIIVQKKMFGYCSFLYFEAKNTFPELDYMVLDRLSFIASLHLLNEKTSFEAMERMKGYFLEQIISGQFASKKEILQRGRFINVDLEFPYHIVILKHQYLDDYLKKELVFYEELLDTIVQYFNKKNTEVIIGQHAANTVLFVQFKKSEGKIEQLCHEFISQLTTKYRGAIFQIGISTIAEDIVDAPEYYQEALSALEMTNPNQKVVSFGELGLVGMLMHSKDERAVIQKAKYLLNPLINNSSNKDTELVKTLYVFLQNGGNLERTMDELALSKTGLRYRLQKIESCLDVDIRDPEVSFQLRLTLQVLVIKGEINLG